MTTFLRLLDTPVDVKPTELLRTLQALRDPGAPSHLVFERDPMAFSAVPGSPFAYWVSAAVSKTFSRHPRLEQHYIATRGAYTTDDFKYYRLTWEVPAAPRAKTRAETLGRLAYIPLAKGGSFSPYYADIHLVVRWHDDGVEAKAFLSAYRERKGWGTDWSACLNGYSYYFRPGLTWPRRTNGLSFRVMPIGCIFADKGPAVFVDGDSFECLLSLNALVNSLVFGYLVSVQLARTELAQSYEVGLIQQTPVPDLSDSDRTILARLARRAWSLKRSLDTTNETSHAFLLPPDVNERVTGLDRAAVDRELGEIQRRIDDEAFRLYGITAEDRAAIERTAKAPSRQEDEEEDSEPEDSDEASDETHSEPLASWRLGGFLSYLVGVAFGRFDPRLATGERPIPPEPEPFDALPARSPGMWPENEPWRLGALAVAPDILVDDEGHTDDLTARAVAIADRVKVDVPDDLRGWLARDFFPLHIKMYSKSRRKAPIYWQLATPSASYSVWLYIHAFSKDTLFRVQNDYALPKLAHEERRLEFLKRENEDEPPRRQDAKEEERNKKSWRLGALAVSSQQERVEELRGFLDEVKRVAPLWNPDLDDGVIINFAPLWRLVPQNKAWQKELKATWDALSEGIYDWAHLAMHLWPERVVPKCAKDRSLAIAHGLEDVLWVEDDKGKWSARKAPTKSVDELVEERTSPAVKAALKSLLEAPMASGSGGRGRGGRRRAPAGADERGGR